MRPFRLSPSGKDYIWGGTRLKTEFHKDIELDPLAETWECSTHPDGPSRVMGGEFDGMTLAQAIEACPQMLGAGKAELPVLIKFIDARSDLSVQVHPDDAYAAEHEGGQKGKTEMWYVVDAEPGAELVFGLSREISSEELRSSIAKGTLEKYLRRVPVHRNDVFYIPSGTIHAIGRGALIAEIQQCSNLTYRLYDYGRLGKDGKPRQLHVEKAVEVSDLGGKADPRQPMRVLRYRPGVATETLCSCRYFMVERWIVKSEEGILLSPLPESFRNVLCIRGEGMVADIPVRKGDSVFIPAGDEGYKVSGDLEMLVTRC